MAYALYLGDINLKAPSKQANTVATPLQDESCAGVESYAPVTVDSDSLDRSGSAEMLRLAHFHLVL